MQIIGVKYCVCTCVFCSQMASLKRKKYIVERSIYPIVINIVHKEYKYVNSIKCYNAKVERKDI